MPGNSEQIKTQAAGYHKHELLEAELQAMGFSDLDLLALLSRRSLDIVQRMELERERQKPSA